MWLWILLAALVLFFAWAIYAGRGHKRDPYTRPDSSQRNGAYRNEGGGDFGGLSGPGFGGDVGGGT